MDFCGVRSQKTSQKAETLVKVEGRVGAIAVL